MKRKPDLKKRREPAWLLFVHRVPQKPDYHRVKIRRRLQSIGAVAVKNSVYLLPRNDQTLEDFQWTMREIAAIGGEASICEASFVDGFTDEQIRALFVAERAQDYKALAEEARTLARSFGNNARRNEDKKKRIQHEADRMRRKLLEVAAIDFFQDSGRKEVERMIDTLEACALEESSSPSDVKESQLPAVGRTRGRVWVTRTNVHVDRIASAWLIRRFIDPAARFKFVDEKSYKPPRGDLRFDMFEGEFTHDGDICTFEVLLSRFGLAKPGLTTIAKIIHDLDLKDGKFGLPETAGIAASIAGICSAEPKDSGRLARGCSLFDDLLAHFGRTLPTPRRGRTAAKMPRSKTR